MQHTDEHRLRNKAQAKRYLNISDSSLERAMRNGLKFVKIGNLVRFRDEDLAQYIAENTRDYRPAPGGDTSTAA